MAHKNLSLAIVITALLIICESLMAYPTTITVQNNSDKQIDFQIFRFYNPRLGAIYGSLNPRQSKTTAHLGYPVELISRITYENKTVPYDSRRHVFAQPNQDAQGNQLPTTVIISEPIAHETLYFSEEDPDIITVLYDGTRWIKVLSYTQYIQGAATEGFSATKGWLKAWWQKFFGPQ